MYNIAFKGLSQVDNLALQRFTILVKTALQIPTDVLCKVFFTRVYIFGFGVCVVRTPKI